MRTNEAVFLEQLQHPQTRQEAFRVLVKDYKERLYWHIRNIVKDHDDTDDILQNTYIKIFKNIDKFKGESKLYSWMYRIATNEAINFLNKEARKVQISSTEHHQSLIENLESDIYFEGSEIQLKLQKAVATLPEKQQLVFNMKYFEELKYKQIAEILETSEGALKASYHIAVKKIEEFLKTN